MRPWLEPHTWELAANRLAGYRLHGFAELLSAESLRLSTAMAIAAVGVAPTRISADPTSSSGPGTSLVVGDPVEAVIGLSYPHETAEPDATWDATIGEVTTEFVRLASYPGVTDRLVALATTNRLRRHLAAASARTGVGLDLDADVLHLRAAAMTSTLLGGSRPPLHDPTPRSDVTAHQLVRTRVDADLEILVYLVDPARVGTRPLAPAPVSQVSLPPTVRSPTPSLSPLATRPAAAATAPPISTASTNPSAQPPAPTTAPSLSPSRVTPTAGSPPPGGSLDPSRHHHFASTPAEPRRQHSLMALPPTMTDLDTASMRTSPTIWAQLTDCVAQLDQPFSRPEIVAWFRRHHPGTLEVSLTAHIQSATSRPGRPLSSMSRTPLITRIDRDLYVRYES